jgi:hypothetical protein
MKITQSAGYHRNFMCDMDNCERHFCKKHRLLWADCETLKRGTQGDRDVVNGTADYYELGDCPLCEHDDENKKFEEEMRRHAAF